MSDMMYRLILKARFEDEAELERVLQGLERLQVQGANVTVKMGTMGRETAWNLNRIARAGLSVGFMFNMLESAYMRQTLAVITLDNAQDRLNATIEKYGANSEEAEKAAKQLELRTNYLNMANMRANISMGLMLTQLALQSGLLEKATLAQIAHTAVVSAATIKEWLHVAALKAKAVLMAIVSGGAAVPLMIAGGVAGGIAIGALTAPVLTAAPVPKSEINIRTELRLETNLDEALAEQNRQVKQEYRSVE